ncbi:MAG: IMP cyclohydrolase [Methanosarcinales archaeon Met12]|nr:MAG: IMP cyclohydrolase [Methanosarcinales archaeon Met12]
MYIGRIVAIGCSGEIPFAGYRVSSRSFPNRIAEIKDDVVLIVPKDIADLLQNPYISYNCIKIVGDVAVASNGSHTDPIAEKIQLGYPPRDALALGLLTMDYEKDSYNTPRIAGVVDVSADKGYLGIIKSDGLTVREFKLKKDDAQFVATYEQTDFKPLRVKGATAGEIARSMYGLDFEHPVCTAAAVWDGEFKMGVYNG